MILSAIYILPMQLEDGTRIAMSCLLWIYSIPIIYDIMTYETKSKMRLFIESATLTLNIFSIIGFIIGLEIWGWNNMMATLCLIIEYTKTVEKNAKEEIKGEKEYGRKWERNEDRINTETNGIWQ